MSELPNFVIHPAAAQDTVQAARWYAKHSARAAAAFREEISRAIEQVRANPQRWLAGPHGTRRLLMRTFPFALVYRELPGAIQLLAVAHGHRRPGYWKDRL